jgi:hypothetical protein
MVETDPEKWPIGYTRVSTYGQSLDNQRDRAIIMASTDRAFDNLS